MHATHRLLVAAVSAIVLGAPTVFAQAAQPIGPGQSVARPAAECPATISCTYSERNFLPNRYRIQKLDVCGANCTSQYWISNMSDDGQLLGIDPIRGGGIIAVGGATAQDPHPAVRTVLPDPRSGDPACTPLAPGWSASTETSAAANPGTSLLSAHLGVVGPQASSTT